MLKHGESLKVKLPQAQGSNLEFLVFGGERKTREPKQTLLEQGQETTANSTHIQCWIWDTNLGQISGKATLSPLSYPCFHKNKDL